MSIIINYGGFSKFAFFLSLLLFSCKSGLDDTMQMVYDSLPEEIDYNFHIKPILSDRCYNCHGPDPETRKAGLRLDIQEEAFKKLVSGKRAFVKGSIRKSEVFHRMLSDNPDLMMPPPDSKLTISSEEIALIAKWIDQGAEWKEHWSFLPLQKPTIPVIEKDWIRHNPIDHFVQVELLNQGFQPSQEAQKERLIKRVTMDLTGLPPTIEEVDQFVEDPDNDAYEKLVDRLLQTDAHAERMAQEWMDVSRYSDSHGISFDGYRTSWPFRDWLIRAFKKNLPYDDFVTHQLAGDLIDDANDESKIATAFVRMNPLEASAGSIPEEFRVEYVNERASLTGAALLGLTLECAKCHDHKFDPITQKEFFQVSAFFNTTIEYGLAPTDSDRAPTLIMLSDQEKVEIDSFLSAIGQKEMQLQALRQKNIPNYDRALPLGPVKGEIGYYAFDKIEFHKKEKKRRWNKEKKKEFEEIQILDNNKKAEANLKVSLTEGKFGQAAYFSEEYDLIKLQEIGEFDHTDPFSISTWINTEKAEVGSTQTIIGNVGEVFAYHRGWDLALDSNNHVQIQLIHRLPDEIIRVRSEHAVVSGQWHHIGFTYDGSKAGEGITIFIDGYKVNTIIELDQLKRSIIPISLETLKPDTIPLTVGKSNRRHMFDMGMFKGSIDEIKIYDRELSHWEMGLLGQSNPDPESVDFRNNHWYLNDGTLVKNKTELRDLRVQVKAMLDKAEEVMIMEEMESPRKTYVLDKGLYNQYKEEVQPGGISKVLPFKDSYPRNRLGLAKWLFDEENPIVARVAINRYWQMIFGRGLVTSSEDFGSQGMRPSHPELLDWLAKDLMDNDWDIRYAIKQMVMSHTYRQSSIVSPELREKDPENLYLAVSPSYRWPAEFIRDNALKASGLLAEQVGGPSVKPYQPAGLWEEVLAASQKLGKYKQNHGDSLYRRSLYTFSRRFAPHPYMINFDATPREICTIRRNTTNTPLQALTLLNDPQFIEASRVLSEKIRKEYSESPQKQIEIAFKRATGLSPNNEQIKSLEKLYWSSLEMFKASPERADSILSVGEKVLDNTLAKVETAAMTMVVSTIFNFDESYMKR